MEKFDIVILGSGAAAFAAALKAAQLGKSVAMVEKKTIGGTCVNVGCVPSKHLLSLSDKYFHFNGFDRPLFGQIIRNKDNLVEELRKKKYIDVLKSRPNIEFFQGRAKFVSNEQVQVEDNVILSADKFVIATGSSPTIFPISGIDSIDYLTSNEALSLQELPESLVVIGGGAVGLELAQMLLHFGSKVTVLEKLPNILPGEEPEISDSLRYHLEKEGMKIHTGVNVDRFSNDGDLKVVSASNSEGRFQVKSSKVLIAVGRTPNTSELNLEAVGVQVDRRKAVVVDDEMRTTAPNIWAAGDVTGKQMLETLAAKQGNIAAENALTGSVRRIDYSAVPHAVFTNPQVASVGLTDREAVQNGHRCNCRVVGMDLVPKSEVVGDSRGIIKMVIDNKTKRILGVHIVSPNAADMIHEAVIAVKFGLTIDDIIDTVHVFPTYTEAIKLAAESYYVDISNMSCCIE